MCGRYIDCSWSFPDLGGAQNGDLMRRLERESAERMRRLEKEFADKERFLDDKYSAESKSHRGISTLLRDALPTPTHLSLFVRLARLVLMLQLLVLLDATTRLSDQVDGQLRTINELNNVVSDHERTIGKAPNTKQVYPSPSNFCIMLQLD